MLYSRLVQISMDLSQYFFSVQSGEQRLNFCYYLMMFFQITECQN